MRRVQIYHLGARQVCWWVKGESSNSLQSGSQNVVPKPAAAASRENTLEMQILNLTQTYSSEAACNKI